MKTGLLAGLVLAAASTVSAQSNKTQTVCQRLEAEFPNATSFSADPAYTVANNDFWSITGRLGPACIFTPTRAQDLGYAVRLLKRSKVPFAVRGGGHMPNDGFNNINSTGILLNTRAFRRIAVSRDQKSLHFGPGLQWQDVYKFLEPYGRLVVGGRVGIVGIPGYFLGGGVSFMGNQYGWAANSLVRLEVVLASGRVVNITNHNKYSDLLWAMKGGANSFGIVTDIEAKLYPASGTSIGYAVYGGSDAVKAQWQDALVQLAYTGNADERHGIIPTSVSLNNGPTGYSAFKFHNGCNDTNPAIFANFSAPRFNATTDSFAPKTMYNFTQEPPGNLVSLQANYVNRFYNLNLPASITALRVAQDIAERESRAFLGNGQTSFSVFAFTAMPMPTSFFRNAKRLGGDPQGIDPDVDGPQIWLEISHTFAPHVGGEPAVSAYLTRLDRLLREGLDAAGTPAKKFLYLNDADKSQDVFAGYPRANLQRLKRIRNKYDPSRLLTDRLIGGFKVDPRR